MTIGPGRSNSLRIRIAREQPDWALSPGGLAGLRGGEGPSWTDADDGEDQGGPRGEDTAVADRLADPTLATAMAAVDLAVT